MSSERTAPPAETRRRVLRRRVAWAVAYVATMGAVCGGMFWARRAILASGDEVQRAEAWRQWHDDAARIGWRVKSDRPPAQVIMHDYFWGTLASVLVIASFLFAFLGFVLVGACQGERRPRGP